MKRILKCSLFCLLFFSQTVNGNEEKVNIPEEKKVEIIKNEEKNTLEKIVEVGDISETAPSTEEKAKDAPAPKINSEDIHQGNNNQKPSPSKPQTPVIGTPPTQTSPVESNNSSISESEVKNYDESVHQDSSVESNTSASSEDQVGASAEKSKPIEETKKTSDNVSGETLIKREENNKPTIVLFKNLSLFKVVVLALVFSLTIVVAVLATINNNKDLRKV